MKNIEKILNFNGKEISLVLDDGQWWIAVKPICDALNVNYNRQFQNLKSDEVLSQLFAEQQTTGADGKGYKMVCLPERYIYGWLFSIRSESEALLEYKRECYDVLFNHFHGRFSALVERAKIEEEIENHRAELAANEHFQEIIKLEERKKKIPALLRKMDADLVKGQTRMVLNI